MALRGAHFSLAAGEIHGLVGENGAGKSTLMKIIAGVHTDYDGEMRIDGRPVRFASPRDARAAGIGMVHQELAIMPDLRVAENVHLGALPRHRFGLLDWRAMRRRAAEHLRESRDRRRSAHADGRPAARAAATGGNRARAVLRRQDHYPGRADLGPGAAGEWNACSACCAGCAMPGAASSSSRISSTTCWRSVTGSRCSATAMPWPPKHAPRSTSAGSSTG